jgi:hypothetical protein
MITRSRSHEWRFISTVIGLWMTKTGISASIFLLGLERDMWPQKPHIPCSSQNRKMLALIPVFVIHKPITVLIKHHSCERDLVTITRKPLYLYCICTVCPYPKSVATNNYIDHMPLPQTALYGS